MFVLLIGIIAVLDVVASVLLRIWAGNDRPLLLVLGVAGFSLAGLAFAFSMKFQGLAVANVIWIGASIILVTLMSIFAFHEHLSSRQIAGMALVIAGLCLVGG